MLIRALAGIWPFGAGRIEQPARDRIFFLSRQPYLPIGSLRAAVCYPSAPGAFPDERTEAALRTFGLDALAARRGSTTTNRGRKNSPPTSSSDSRWRACCYKRPTGSS